MNITGLWDIAQVNTEIGGALYFMGINLTLINSTLINNTGFRGAIYITNYASDVTQYILINSSYFKYNRGNFGGAINFCSYLTDFTALVCVNVFVENVARSKSKLNFIKNLVNLFDLDGACIGTDYLFPSCKLTISKSYFLSNMAMYGGVISFESFNSFFEMNECFCDKNIGVNPYLLIGGGAVIMIKGDSSSLAFTFNNTFLASIGSLTGHI